MPSKGRDNREYRDLSRALKRIGKRDNLPCWICKREIDYDLDAKHAMSYTYDHEVAVANGGKMRGKGRPAHKACNSRRGAGRVVKAASFGGTNFDPMAGPKLSTDCGKSETGGVAPPPPGLFPPTA